MPDTGFIQEETLQRRYSAKAKSPLPIPLRVNIPEGSGGEVQLGREFFWD
jgi:hypothetical protein